MRYGANSQRHHLPESNVHPLVPQSGDGVFARPGSQPRTRPAALSDGPANEVIEWWFLVRCKRSLLAQASHIAAQANVSFEGYCGSGSRVLKPTWMTRSGTLLRNFAATQHGLLQLSRIINVRSVSGRADIRHGSRALKRYRASRLPTYPA